MARIFADDKFQIDECCGVILTQKVRESALVIALGIVRAIVDQLIENIARPQKIIALALALAFFKQRQGARIRRIEVYLPKLLLNQLRLGRPSRKPQFLEDCILIGLAVGGSGAQALITVAQHRIGQRRINLGRSGRGKDEDQGEAGAYHVPIRPRAPCPVKSQ